MTLMDDTHMTESQLKLCLHSNHHQHSFNIVVRPIQLKDNFAIAEVIRNSFKENKIDHLEGVSLHDPALAQLSKAYLAEKAQYWVAEYQGKIVGGVGIAPLIGASGEYCEMQKLYLDKQVLRIGLGRQLIALSIEKAQEFGYHYCYLETLEELSSAVSLYEEFGFQHLEQAVGNTGHNSCEIRMLKKL